MELHIVKESNITSSTKVGKNYFDNVIYAGNTTKKAIFRTFQTTTPVDYDYDFDVGIPLSNKSQLLSQKVKSENLKLILKKTNFEKE